MAWKGVKFPVVADEKSVIAGDKDEALIQEDIRQLLCTGKGERVRRPQFGTRLWLFLHEPLTAPTLQLIRVEILDALRDWEPRIIVKDVTVKAIAETQKVAVSIKYVLRTTGVDRVFDLTVST